MSEPNPASMSPAVTPLPARHGAPWESEEFHQLMTGIEQGLTLAQLAERHQRTPASINGAARRLVPPAVRPNGWTQSVDVLARYLRETEGVDRKLLVCGVRPTPTMHTAVEPTRDLSSRTRIAEHRDPASATARPVFAGTHRADAGAHLGASPAPLAPATYGDVTMLVCAAVAGLPSGRHRDVLEMRLGIEGQPLTLAEIGARWGVSRERVRQIQEGALRRLAARARYADSPGAALQKLVKSADACPRTLARWVCDVALRGFEVPPSLATKAILRAAGVPGADVKSVVALVAAIGAAASRLDATDGSRATLERRKAVIERWLQHAEWPVALSPPPPTTQLASMREVNDSDIAGRFYSRKLNRTVQYESGLELEVLMALECSDQVAYYQEQPAMIPYAFKGRQRTYYPDLFVATVDGRGILIEVKPTDSMALSVSRAKADAGRAWAHVRGWGWLLVSDRHTFRQVEDHGIPAVARMLLDNELAMRGALTWRDLIDLRIQHGLTRLDLTAYIIQSGAELDREYRVTLPDRSFSN